MMLHEAIGYALFQESDITNIVGSNIWHGDRPESGDPCINYFEVSYGLLAYNAIETSMYQISCRASEAGVVQNLARKVCVLFQDMKKKLSTFDIQMATVENKFMLRESTTKLWHIPIDIRFIHEEAIVS